MSDLLKNPRDILVRTLFNICILKPICVSTFELSPTRYLVRTPKNTSELKSYEKQGSAILIYLIFRSRQVVVGRMMRSSSKIISSLTLRCTKYSNGVSSVTR